MNDQIHRINDIIKQVPGLRYDSSAGIFETDRRALYDFAELIVQECIQTITTYDLVPGHSAKWEDIYEIHARLLQDLGEELKEHFGVEK